MSNTKNIQSTNIGNKIRSSLVLKLNIQMIGKLTFDFLKLNIFIIMMALTVIIWKAEEGGFYIITDIMQKEDNNTSEYYRVNKYSILKHGKKLEGKKTSNIINKYMPLKSKDTIREISQIGTRDDLSLVENIYLAKYVIDTTIDGISYRIIYDIGSDFKLLLYLIIILLGCEILIIIKNIPSGMIMIRKTLRPLSELAQTAKVLNEQVIAMSLNREGDKLKDLAGVISNIDASKLDRKISVDTSQNELKELAYAINDMLNRINESYKSQVRFVSDASHELRTPISVIQGYINLLDRWGKKDEQTLDESISAIKGETENMKELVEKLLFLARGDSETIQLYKEKFDICEVASEIIREMKMIDKDHNFVYELDKPSYINADRQLIKQAIRILVDNSIKYTPKDKKITLKIEKDNGNIKVIVQDNGIGIDSEYLPHIFDRFYRSDESRARKTGGSGLGLSIAKWIIERHDAYFEIISRVNIGTRTTIVFPAENDS